MEDCLRTIYSLDIKLHNQRTKVLFKDPPKSYLRCVLVNHWNVTPQKQVQSKLQHYFHNHPHTPILFSLTHVATEFHSLLSFKEYVTNIATFDRYIMSKYALPGCNANQKLSSQCYTYQVRFLHEFAPTTWHEGIQPSRTNCGDLGSTLVTKGAITGWSLWFCGSISHKNYREQSCL